MKDCGNCDFEMTPAKLPPCLWCKRIHMPKHRDLMDNWRPKGGVDERERA